MNVDIGVAWMGNKEQSNNTDLAQWQIANNMQGGQQYPTQNWKNSPVIIPDVSPI